MRGKKGRIEFDKRQNRADAEKSTFTANMKYKRKEKKPKLENGYSANHQ